MRGVSDTTDVPGDLLRLALMIATGAWIAKTSFDGEPNEWRLIADHVWEPARAFRIRVLEFRDIGENADDKQGHLAFEANCDKAALCRSILGATSAFLDSQGSANYGWGGNDFPSSALAALKEAIAVNDKTGWPGRARP
jgi:hypothetical protein